MHTDEQLGTTCSPVLIQFHFDDFVNIFFNIATINGI